MRITHLTDRYFPAVGGVETHVYNLCRFLNRYGVNTDVITTDIYSTNPLLYIKRSMQDGLKTKKGIKLLPLPQGLGIFSPGMVTELHGDIIHAHGLGRFPTFLWWVARSKSRPFVITTHSDFGRQHLFKRIFDAIIPPLSIKQADSIIAVSQHERKYLNRLGIREEIINVIPNGIDLDELKRYVVDVRRKNKSVVFAGRLDMDQKGLDVLLTAVSMLVRRGYPRLRCYIAGPQVGNSYSQILALAEMLGITKNIILLGTLRRESLLRLIAETGILVLPSRFEPFGVVILEAMAVGTPVVASRVGGIPEVLGGGKYGILVEPGQAGSLADGIEELLADENKAIFLSKTSLAEVEKYSWYRVARETISLYSRLLN